MVGIGRPCRRPISKSFGSCAGVTLTAPVRIRIDVGIGDDDDLAVQERVRQRLADQRAVAVVIGMHRDGGVAEHGFQPGGGHHDVRFVVVHRPVPERHQLTLDVLVFDLEVGDGGLQHR
jgi:hypothetical protein